MKYDNIVEKNCENCAHFDTRTHFCRLNPPLPVIYNVKENNTWKQIVTSKFPVITHSEIDYCSHFKQYNLITEED